MAYVKLSRRYEIKEQLSQDVLSQDVLYTSYSAEDVKEKKAVSVSILSAAAQRRAPETLMRYRQSAEKLKGLKAAGLQEVLETGQDEEQRDYVVYAAGGSLTLEAYLSRRESARILSCDQAAAVLLTLCEGLTQAHQRKVLHGSINTANILIEETVASSQSLVASQDQKEEDPKKPATSDPATETSAGRQRPATVLTPQLTRFGFSLLTDLVKVKEPQDIKRVFGYLAPEATGILKKPIDQRTDIYELGIVFYELVCGKLPYEYAESADLIHAHIAENPIPPAKVNPDLSPVLEKMILRMIAKDPLERYQSVDGLIHDLKEYQRRVEEIKEKWESSAPPDLRGKSMRGGELQAAIAAVQFEIAREDRLKELNFTSKLIGREKELQELKACINRSQASQGGVCLIHGEPGVGKSRLVDELRAHMHVRRGIFAGGKCDQYAFAAPYHVLIEAIEVWIDKVKRLSQKEQDSQIQRLKETLGQLGAEVVKLTPRIKELIGEPEALVALDSPDREKIRFLITVSDFIANLGSKENPLLLFLDDLQWVDEGTLEILERVIPKSQEKPLTLILSYRSTEVDENHILSKTIKKIVANSSELVVKAEKQIVANSLEIVEKTKETNEQGLLTTNSQLLTSTDYQLQATNFIKNYPILPFNTTETAQLLSQILLEPIDSMLLLAAYLQERTQGNPFFTLELLRTLYEEKLISLQDSHYTYDLNRLKQAILPANVVDIVLKRIKDISQTDKQILSYASVMGKEIGLELLSKLTHKDLSELMNTVESSISNQLLYRDLTGKEEVYFIHDRVRESFYSTLSSEEKIPLHKQIAESIEETHKENLDEMIYDLAYHYTQGQVEDKALIYSIQGGKEAQKSYSNELAIRLYETAREILERQRSAVSGQEIRRSGNQENDDLYLDLLENLGEVYRMAGRFEDSVAALKKCESLISPNDTIHKARVLSKMADTLWDSGKTEDCIKVLEQALHILKVSFPTGKAGVVLGILTEFIIQMFHTWFPKFFVANEYKGTPKEPVIIRLLDRLGHVYYFSDMNKTFCLYLKTLNRAEKVGPCPELAHVYTVGAVVWSTFPWFSRAFRDGNKGLKMAQKLQDKLREGSAYAYLGFSLYSTNKPKESIEYAQKGIQILKSVGEYWDLGVAYTGYMFSSVLIEKLTEGKIKAEEFIKSEKEVSALQVLGWAYCHKAKILTLQGEIGDQTIELFNKAIELARQVNDKPNIMFKPSVLALLYARRKEYNQAIRILEQSVPLFSTHYNKSIYSLEIFCIGAQIYLDAVADTPNLSAEQRKHYLKRVRWFVLQSRKWSVLYKFFNGWSYQVWGTYNWLSGRKKKAEKLWDKGLHWLRSNKGNPGGDKYRIAYLLLEEARYLLEDELKGSATRQKASAGLTAQNRAVKKAYANLQEAKELFAGMGCVLDLKTCEGLLAQIAPEGEVIDQREAFRSRRHLDSLLNVARAIGSEFNPEILLPKIMDYARKVTGAERGFLLLYDKPVSISQIDSGQEAVLELKVSSGLEAELQSQAFSYEGYGLSLELIKEAEMKEEALIVDSSSELVGKAKEDQLLTTNSKLLTDELRAYQVKQAIAVPLKAQNKLGILYLDNRLAGGTFGIDELELMKGFSVQASVSIENTRLVGNLLEQERLKQEMELGRDIQMNLLPKAAPEVEGLKIQGLMIPAKEIGGDYYDYIVTSAVSSKLEAHRVRQDSQTAYELPATSKIAIVIGDVSGKGVAAGLIMATAKATLKGLSEQGLSPKQTLVRANSLLYEYTKGDKFMTMLYLTWNPQQKRLNYSSAGHEHIIIYRGSGKLAPSSELIAHREGQEAKNTCELPATSQIADFNKVEVILSGGFMLGMLEDIEGMLEDNSLQLNSGDKVVLYTDGVTEARNPVEELYTLERLTEVVKHHGHKSSDQLMATIKEEVYGFISTQAQYDDITLVVMECVPSDYERK